MTFISHYIKINYKVIPNIDLPFDLNSNFSKLGKEH